MKEFLRANSENWYFNHIVKIHCNFAVDFLISLFLLVKHSVSIPNKRNYIIPQPHQAQFPLRYLVLTDLSEEVSQSRYKHLIFQILFLEQCV